MTDWENEPLPYYIIDYFPEDFDDLKEWEDVLNDQELFDKEMTDRQVPNYDHWDQDQKDGLREFTKREWDELNIDEEDFDRNYKSE